MLVVPLAVEELELEEGYVLMVASITPDAMELTWRKNSAQET